MAAHVLPKQLTTAQPMSLSTTGSNTRSPESTKNTIHWDSKDSLNVSLPTNMRHALYGWVTDYTVAARYPTYASAFIVDDLHAVRLKTQCQTCRMSP